MEQLRILLPLSADYAYSPVNSASHQKLVKLGFSPIVVTPLITNGQLEEAYTSAHGLVFPGGKDIDPAMYKQPPHPKIGELDPALDKMQYAILRKLRKTRHPKPVLAICRGAQMLSIESGGSLFQELTDITDEPHGVSIEVEGESSKHDVFIASGSKAFEIFNTNKLTDVISRHHQGIADPGKLIVSGKSPKGIIEIVEHPSLPFHVGVQTHPELTDALDNLFSAFAVAVKESRNLPQSA